MTMDEILVAQATHEGEARGEARMKESKELSFVQTLITDTDFNNEKIASLAAVTEAFVEKVRGSSVLSAQVER